jgi:RIO kinase 1
MRIPESLVPLVDHGVVDEVVRSLKSGKEADVYLVASEGFFRVAKVYKDAQSRSFKNRAAYTEGRQVRSSRDQRAMDKGSKYGKAQNEAAWQSAEVDMIYRLDAAGVRVPKPFHFIDGVLIMELVATDDGQPAPRLGEMEFTAEEATAIFTKLLADVVKMLAAGVVHGDLSEFNVLVAAEGPVIIDFPQSVNASKNQGARKMLLRDVQNLQDFLKRYVPGTPQLYYAEEMWQLYEKGELTAESALTGKFTDDRKQANTTAVLGHIDEARRDERFKRQQSGRSFRGMGNAGASPHPQGATAGAATPLEHAKPAAQRSQRPPNPHGPKSHAPQGPKPQAPQAQRPQHPAGPRGKPPREQHPQPRHAPGGAPRPTDAPTPAVAVRPAPVSNQPTAVISNPPREARFNQGNGANSNPPRQHHSNQPRSHHPAPARPPNPNQSRPPNPNQSRPPNPNQSRPPNPHPARAGNATPPRAQTNPRPPAQQSHRPPAPSGQPNGSNQARPQNPRPPSHHRARPNPIVETRPTLPGGGAIARPPPRK